MRGIGLPEGKQRVKQMIRRIVNWSGYDITRKKDDHADYPADFSAAQVEVIKWAQPYTMTEPERIVGLMSAVRYIVKNRIPGDFVECGVWRGGSMMVVLRTLLELGETERLIHLFDTFQGMTPPGNKDVMHSGHPAGDLLATQDHVPARNLWCWATRDDVRHNMLSTGYPPQNIHFVEGDVLETIPSHAPQSIALLRLDTDWYESTKHELVHLYPRLNPGGVMIIDDYGHWKGAREATDEYFETHQYKPLLHRLDYTGRCVVKML